MKARLDLILLSITAIPFIYFVNGANHWSQLPFLAYLIYSFIVGTISAFRKK